jgi:hypothetical protein
MLTKWVIVIALCLVGIFTFLSPSPGSWKTPERQRLVEKAKRISECLKIGDDQERKKALIECEAIFPEVPMQSRSTNGSDLHAFLKAQSAVVWTGKLLENDRWQPTPQCAEASDVGAILITREGSIWLFTDVSSTAQVEKINSLHFTPEK